MFDLSKLTYEELETLYAATRMALDDRKYNRFKELAERVCEAVNALTEEFPSTELIMEYQCSDCFQLMEIDVLDYFCGGHRKLTAECFNR